MFTTHTDTAMHTIPLSLEQTQPLKLNSTWNAKHQGPKTQEEMERADLEKVGEKKKDANDAGFIAMCCDVLRFACQ